ncbi:hypothetical protein AURDEDRAFT_165531, partial [Auricularia subglabra TFB-10046 SS5]
MDEANVFCFVGECPLAGIDCLTPGGNALVGSKLAADVDRAFEATYAYAAPPSNPFQCAPEDVQWQEDLVLLGPFNAQGGELIDPLAYTLDDASVVDVKTVRLLPGMIPGDAHAFLTLTHRPTSREYTVTGDVYPFCHAGCFAIFAAVLSKSPRALSYPERVLWAVIRKRNLGARNASAVAGVHYGAELERTRRKRA